MPENLKPSPTELSILKSLWRQSPLSAREIHDKVSEQLQWSFSSTRKTLDRMSGKGFVSVSDVHGVKVYAPMLSKLSTLASFVKDFSRRVLEVDGPLPVSMFVDSKLLDENEMKELETLLLQDESDQS